MERHHRHAVRSARALTRVTTPSRLTVTCLPAAAGAMRVAPPASVPSAMGVPPARWWPFVRRVTPGAGTSVPSRIHVGLLEEAFPANQTPGTRMVLTQATYQLQRWLDWLDVHPETTVTASLSTNAGSLLAEARARRGPWARVSLMEQAPGAVPALVGGRPPDTRPHGPDTPAWTAEHEALAASFWQPDPVRRRQAATDALRGAPADAAISLALASACMETGDLTAALDALDAAAESAPDWEAVHFERGKLWLRADDTARAAESFADAVRLMPSFASAATNLGGALAELGRTNEALAALEQALRFDPYGYPVVNNLGAAYRELGRLDEAEAAFRRVIALADGFVFGHYNLGHTLLLQGRFAEARDAYAEGARRDPQQNVRQACRLELARAAAGDGVTAAQRLEALASSCPGGLGEEILDELDATLEALAGVPQASAPDVARAHACVRALMRAQR